MLDDFLEWLITTVDSNQNFAEKCEGLQKAINKYNSNKKSFTMSTEAEKSVNQI